MRKNITILFFFSMCLSGFASTVTDANKALSVYDYFKAKTLFYKALKKHACDGAYGLAVIYSRHDNPFTNMDSAARYMGLSLQAYKVRTKEVLVKQRAIDSLATLIGYSGYTTFTTSKQISKIEHFLQGFYFAGDNLRERAYWLRDSLRFLQLRGHSDSMLYFMRYYPESALSSQAFRAYEYDVYHEQVKHHSRAELESFISKYPNNSYRGEAEDALFAIIRQTHQPQEIYAFIRTYSTSYTSEQAWKYLYSISVVNYSQKELQDFLAKYPEYPYKQNVEKEIHLSSAVMIPLKNKDDKWGYADTAGYWKIAPQFDDVSEFREGYAAVSMNDTCYYIDKEGKRASGGNFSEASDYNNGVAVVKQRDLYYLINRTGQLVSKGYQEIGDLSDNLYVVKQGTKYGAINHKGAVVIPVIYNKLGDFKRGYAYYLADTYGLVDTLNHVYDARWDWISDVDTNGIAIVKRGNLFGLLHAPQNVILEPAFDYIRDCVGSIFIVVKNNLYGFYDAAEQCFITSVAFDYSPQYQPSYYTNGKLFRRLRDDEVSLVDANGRVSIDYGKYENVFFAKEDMIRIERNNKYGFVDRKLKTVINTEYEKATDFENGRALVTKKETTSLIDKTGKPVFSCKDCEIAPLEAYYIVSANDLNGLMDANGMYILPPEYDLIERGYTHYLIAWKKDELFLFDLRTKLLRKVQEH